MFVEAIDQILAIWRGEPPYDLAGRFWTLSTGRTQIPELGQGTIARPYQQPHPPIIVTAVAPYSKGVAAAAERGWDPISANFLQPKWVKTHWPNYAAGCEKGGRKPDPANWRVAKSIFVADDASDRAPLRDRPQRPLFLLLPLPLHQARCAPAAPTSSRPTPPSLIPHLPWKKSSTSW